MKLSLQSKIAIFLTLTILAISAVSSYLFISAYIRAKEKELIAIGTTLSYTLSKTAEEGLIRENLDLLRQASYIVQTEDLIFMQVYSNIWGAVDAYPFEKINSLPHVEAIKHFESYLSPFYIKLEDGSYDFYNPILFYAPGDLPQVTIGFARVVLSSYGMQKEINRLLINLIAAATVITFIAIVALNALVKRIILNPVAKIYKYVSKIKEEGDLSAAEAYNEMTKTGTLELDAIGMTINEAFKKINRFRQVIDSAFDVIVVTDADGYITYVNPAFETVTGYSREGVIGKKTNILKSDYHDEDFFKNLWNTIKAGNVWKGEFINRKKNGEIYYASSVIFPIYAEGDVHYATIQRDITHEKKLYEQLLRSQKMEAIGTLAGGIAHDFNNLLTAILGYSEIMLGMTKEGDPLYKAAKIINNAGEKSAELARKILMITRKEKMESKPIDINQTIKNSMELLERSIPKNIEIITKLNENLPLTMADPSQIQQVLMNLAVNARDAMPDRGRLIIETALVGTENGAANGVTDSNGEGFIKLSVSDTGMGMDTDTQRKIFDPFFTTKETGKGTGLGLYIVHSIISNHGGYINLYSEPDRGTRFNIYLPIRKVKEAEPALSLMEDIKGSEIILIIDDEPDIRQLCRDMLEPLGYKVLLAGNGIEGINIMRMLKDKISLVILDMIMPQMGGSEVFQALRTIKPDVKVMLCSGYSHEGFAGIDNLLKNGALGFVQKPFTRHSIAQAIKKALSE